MNLKINHLTSNVKTSTLEHAYFYIWSRNHFRDHTEMVTA